MGLSLHEEIFVQVIKLFYEALLCTFDTPDVIDTCFCLDYVLKRNIFFMYLPCLLRLTVTEVIFNVAFPGF
jgi:hypothetical protein